MKKIILSTLLLISFINCKTDNTVMSNVFTIYEIEQLIEVIKYMDSIVINETKKTNLQDAYYCYTQSMNDINITDSLKLSVSHIVDLVDKISALEVFNQIWFRKDYANYRLGTVGEFLFFNEKGKYLEFVRRISNQEDNFNNYYDEIKYWNELSIAARDWFNQNYMNLDINNYDTHLFFVIHLITAMYDKELSQNSYGVGLDGDTIY